MNNKNTNTILKKNARKFTYVNMDALLEKIRGYRMNVNILWVRFCFDRLSLVYVNAAQPFCVSRA